MFKNFIHTLTITIAIFFFYNYYYYHYSFSPLQQLLLLFITTIISLFLPLRQLLLLHYRNNYFLPLQLVTTITITFNYSHDNYYNFYHYFGNNLQLLRQLLSLLLLLLLFTTATTTTTITTCYYYFYQQVVCCAATNCLAWDKCVVHGRFETGNYHPLLYGYKYLNSGISQTPHAKILAPLHPIFYRVKKPFSGGSWAGHVECKVDPRSLLIAQWCNGNPLIAERAIGEARVVALNFGAISSAIGVSDYWSPEDTDNHLIIYNAVKYASKLKIRDWRATLFTIWTTRKRSYTDVIICN